MQRPRTIRRPFRRADPLNDPMLRGDARLALTVLASLILYVSYMILAVLACVLITG